jgi:hypothetical protein
MTNFKRAQDVAGELIRLGIQSEYCDSDITPEKVATWLEGLTGEGMAEVVLLLAVQAGLFIHAIEESGRTGCDGEDVLRFLTEEGDPEFEYLSYARELAEKLKEKKISD